MSEKTESTGATAKTTRRYGIKNTSAVTGNNLLHRTLAEAPKNEQEIRGVELYSDEVEYLVKAYGPDLVKVAISQNLLVVV